MKRVHVFFLVSVLTGCAGLIGVPDLTFDEQAEQGNPDAARADGTTTTDGPTGTTPDAGEAGPQCDTTKLETDPFNCGRCGHDCIGGACTAGKCEALKIGEIPNAPLRHVVEHGDDVFVSTIVTLVDQPGGIWKVGKTSHVVVPYVTGLRYAEAMTVVGDTLYFVVDNYTFDDGGTNDGGLYSCDLNGPTPCVPKLIAPAEVPTALAVDQGNVFYNDDGTDPVRARGIYKYAAAGSSTLFRSGYSVSPFWVAGEGVYYLVTQGTATNDGVILWDLYPDAGDATEVSRFMHDNGVAGNITGHGNSLFYTSFDAEDTLGGVVRRVARPGTPAVAPCDYGGASNKRPYGMHIDGTRIYWTNQGEFGPNFANGSVAYCELEGCCSAPTTHWTGTGEPSDITGDAKGLYWVTRRTGSVWMIAKP
jgi:hypothetical protein